VKPLPDGWRHDYTIRGRFPQNQKYRRHNNSNFAFQKFRRIKVSNLAIRYSAQLAEASATAWLWR
jgi:hypothetical protein